MDWESEVRDVQTCDPVLRTQVSYDQRRKGSSRLLLRRHQQQDSATRVDS